MAGSTARLMLILHYRSAHRVVRGPEGCVQGCLRLGKADARWPELHGQLACVALVQDHHVPLQPLGFVDGADGHRLHLLALLDVLCHTQLSWHGAWLMVRIQCWLCLQPIYNF